MVAIDLPFWPTVGWAFAILMCLLFVAALFYYAFLAISYVFPALLVWIDAKVKGVCYMCRMPKQLGHWPGCDYWKGENLDLLIFREESRDQGGE